MLSWPQKLRTLCFLQENGLTEGPNGERVMGNGALVCDPLLDTKRWHSLEDMPLQNENSKKIITRSSLRAWLFGLFNNSSYRNSDASLRKANCNYMDLQADKESIVWLRLRNFRHLELLTAKIVRTLAFTIEMWARVETGLVTGLLFVNI